MRGGSFLAMALVVASVFAGVNSVSWNLADRDAITMEVRAAGPASPVPQAGWTVLDVWWDFGSNDIFFDWSADSGETWHTDTRINDVAGSAFDSGWQLPLPAVAVDPSNGAIYVAWADQRNGNFDIYFSASTDGGASWSPNTRINDDTGSAIQWMVDLAVDRHGTVHAAWEDKRNGNLNIFYSNSTDGGATWSPNVRVSSEDTPGSYNRPGDYFAIEAGPDDQPYVVWTDGRGPPGSDFNITFARGPDFANVKVTDGSSPYPWQVEPTMVINGSGTIFVGWKETDGPEAAGLRVGASYSLDRGATWAPNILMNQSHPAGGCSNSDPWMALAPNDVVQYAYLEYGCRDGSSGLSVANTTDGAWGTVHYARGGGGLTDKDSIIVAPTGRIYAAWDEGNVMDVTWSDDGGATWASFIDPDDAPGGVLGAVIQIGGPVATITVTTDPAHLPVTVDGATTTGPAVFGWIVGSAHEIGVPSLAPGETGTRFLWTNWSDGGAIVHTITADADRTITAYFQKQDEVKVDTSPKGLEVLVDGVPTTAATSFWWNEGSTHSVEATSPQPVSDVKRYVWSSWSDGGARTHSFSVSDPVTLTATFGDEEAMRVSTSPDGRTFSVNGASYSAATSFWFAPGSQVILSVPTTQSAPGTRYQFQGWSDGGDATHVVAFSGAMSVEARFSVQYYLNVSSPVPGATGSGWYPAGSTVVATAPSAMYATGPGQRLAFLRWAEDASGSGLTSDPILMDGPKEAVAEYRTEYELIVSSSYGNVTGGGWYPAEATASATLSSTEVSQGTGVREAFVGWTGDATGSGATSSPILMDKPKSVAASWQTQYLLQVESEVGTVGGSGWYPAGQIVELRAPIEMTASGTTYRFAGWTGGASGSDPTLRVTLTGPVTVRATWQPAGALDVLGSPEVSIGILVLVGALAVGLLVWRQSRRRG